MILDDFLTTEIIKLSSDTAIQTMCLYYRYLICAFGICRFIINSDEKESIKDIVRSYLDDFQVATVFLGSHLEDTFSDTAKGRRHFKKVDDETWSFVSKEVNNYVISNNVTKTGIIKQLKLAH